MNVPVLALFSRSLRTESRAIGTYAVRFVLVLFVLIALAMAHAGSPRMGAAGLDFFRSLLYVNLVFITLTALYYFPSAITEEKEEETLGLLKLCNLSPVAILLGKSTSRLFGAILLLLAQFPFTLLAVTLGGVSLAQVFAGYATVLAYLILLGNIALFASVCCPTTGWAGGLTAVFVGIVIFGGGILDYALTPYSYGQPPPPLTLGQLLASRLEDISPFERVSDVMQTSFTGSAIGYQATASLVLAVAFFLLAWLAFGFFTREQRSASKLARVLIPRTTSLWRLGVRRPEWSPLAWKEFHFLTGGYLGLIARFVILAGLAGFIAYLMRADFDTPVGNEYYGAALMTVCVCLAAVEFIARMALMFAAEAKGHTLPELLMLPLSTPQILLRKLAGALPTLLPYGVGLVVGAFIYPEGFGIGLLGAVAHPVGWFILSEVVCFAFFHAYMCLVSLRAGTILAFGIWFLSHVVAFPMFSSGMRVPSDETALFLVLSVLLAGIARAFYVALVRKVEEVGSR